MNLMYLGVAVLALLFGTQAARSDPTVYIPLGTGNQVIAIKAEINEIIDTYSGVANPHGLVATPDGEYLVAGSFEEHQGTSKLFLIHPEHEHVMWEIPVEGWTHHQAITPNGRYVISTRPTRGGVNVLDLQTNQIVQTIKTGLSPNYVLVNRAGNRASNSGNGTISGDLDPGLEAYPDPTGGPSARTHGLLT